MRNFIIVTAALLFAATSSASATPFTPLENNPDVLVNQPVPPQLDHLVCFGCVSPSTGMPRTNYVRPHYRSNGSFVNGYWRS